MTRPRFTTVLFDLDGTLANTIPLIVASYRHALEAHGLPVPEEPELRGWIGRTLVDIFTKRHPDQAESIVAELDLADRCMRESGMEHPRIAVAGLNPHAGDGGNFGTEEIDIIEPTLARLRAEGMDLRGPLPADTLFTPKYLEHCDAVLAMYHDQGLPVLKYKGFGAAVNITLGLPIIRTSVDHGTALDLAGTGRADPGSLFAATGLALELALTVK